MTRKALFVMTLVVGLVTAYLMVPSAPGSLIPAVEAGKRDVPKGMMPFYIVSMLPGGGVYHSTATLIKIPEIGEPIDHLKDLNSRIAIASAIKVHELTMPRGEALEAAKSAAAARMKILEENPNLRKSMEEQARDTYRRLTGQDPPNAAMPQDGPVESDPTVTENLSPPI